MLLASTPAPATGWQQGAAEATLFQLMNGARVNNGRRAVQQNGTLVSLARWRSKDQVDRNYFDHTILGTGYQVYHWYDLNGLKYSLGRREHRLEQRLQRRRFAGRHPPGLHGLARPPGQHPGAELHPRRRGRLCQGQRRSSLASSAARASTPSCSWRLPRLRHRLHPPAAAAAVASPQPPPSAAAAALAGLPPARRATSTGPSPTPGRCMSTAPAAPRASDPMDGGTLVAAAPGSASSESVARGLRRRRSHRLPAQPGGQRQRAACGSRPPAAPERGLFETVLGSLLGFVL